MEANSQLSVRMRQTDKSFTFLSGGWFGCDGTRALAIGSSAFDSKELR